MKGIINVCLVSFLAITLSLTIVGCGGSGDNTDVVNSGYQFSGNIQGLGGPIDNRDTACLYLESGAKCRIGLYTTILQNEQCVAESCDPAAQIGDPNNDFYPVSYRNLSWMRQGDYAEVVYDWSDGNVCRATLIKVWDAGTKGGGRVIVVGGGGGCTGTEAGCTAGTEATCPNATPTIPSSAPCVGPDCPSTSSETKSTGVRVIRG